MSRILHFKVCSLSVSTKTESISVAENFSSKFYDSFSKSHFHISVTFKSHEKSLYGSLWTF